MAVKVNGRYISVSINSEYIKLCEATKGAKNTTVHKIVTVGTLRVYIAMAIFLM